MRLDKVDGKVDRLTFDSFTEAINHAREHRLDWRDNPANTGKHTAGDDVETYEQADQLARKGWTLGRETIAKFESALDVCSKVHKPEIQFDVVGDSGFDMGRVIEGIPECVMDWRDTEELHNKLDGKIIKVVVNLFAAWFIKPEQFYRRGAAILALIDALETAGKRVELVVSFDASGEWYRTGKLFSIEVPLKQADESLQIDQLAYALCHPAMFRRQMFSLAYQCGEHGKYAAQHSMGTITTAYKPECEIYLPGLIESEAWTDDQEAIEWVKAQLTDFNVKLDSDEEEVEIPNDY